MEELDLSELVEELRDFIEASVGERVELRFELARGLPPILADGEELRQLIMSLVTNAWEAVGDTDGIISITTDTVGCDRNALAETYLGEDLPEGDYVLLEVSDSGCGMDIETQAKIFDPFFTTKFAGRGLGLAAVLGIVRGVRGALRITSEAGRGTSIRVMVPVLVEAEMAEQEVAAVSTEAHESKTVLVVDDDKVVRSLSREMLEEAGYQVLSAADGREAVDLYRGKAAAVDAVLLDMTMPHMDGDATFGELRKIRADVRVIVSSGYSEQDAMDRFRGARPAGYLQKPYRMTDLLDAVDQVVSNE
jgi:CheY-like chemotaxis protein